MLGPKITSIIIHKLSDMPDAGKIYHQAVSELSSRQGFHYLAAPAVKALIKPLNQLISITRNNSEVKGLEPISTSSLW
jgi:hypothetical protein